MFQLHGNIARSFYVSCNTFNTLKDNGGTFLFLISSGTFVLSINVVFPFTFLSYFSNNEQIYSKGQLSLSFVSKTSICIMTNCVIIGFPTCSISLHKAAHKILKYSLQYGPLQLLQLFQVKQNAILY